MADTWDDPWSDEAPQTATQQAAWLPLSRRSAQLGPDLTLFEGVPAHIEGVLFSWINSQWRTSRETWDELQWRLRLPTITLTELDEGQVLDVVDAMLAWWPDTDQKDWPASTPKGTGTWFRRGPSPLAELREILDIGGSAWRVNSAGDGLERRVDDTVTAAATVATATAEPAASEHLGMAWASVYGRDPDPDKAYSEAVKAVEAAACPLVLPASPTATLGQVRNHLRDAPGKWVIVLPGKDDQPGPADPVVAMMTALWEGQRSRHAGTPSSRRQTQAEAEAAVHLAATLVQWLSGGVLTRTA